MPKFNVGDKVLVPATIRRANWGDVYVDITDGEENCWVNPDLLVVPEKKPIRGEFRLSPDGWKTACYRPNNDYDDFPWLTSTSEWVSSSYVNGWKTIYVPEGS